MPTEQFHQLPLEALPEPLQAPERVETPSDEFLDLYQFENANRERLDLPPVSETEFRQIHETALYDGAEGGKAVFAKYGSEYMRELGKKGFQAMVDKHWGGDREAAVRRLQELGWIAQDEPMNLKVWTHDKYPKRDDEPWDDAAPAHTPLVDFTTEKTEEATSRMREAMQHFTTAEDFKRYLDFQANQYRYSPYNCMLILSQKPDASIVMPYGKKDGTTGWKSLGRWTRPDQRGMGIGILAPMFRGKRDTDEERLIGYKRVTVWDISQTDGKPLPAPPKPEQLTGNDPLGDEIFSRLLDFNEDSLGIDVDYAPLGDKGGLFSFFDGKIVLNEERRGDQSLKTLWHETAHALTMPYAEQQKIDRRDAETIAETSAYIGLSFFGIDTSEYSFKYVAGWAKDMARFEKNVVTSQKIAKDMINLVRQGKEAHE